MVYLAANPDLLQDLWAGRARAPPCPTKVEYKCTYLVDAGELDVLYLVFVVVWIVLWLLFSYD